MVNAGEGISRGSWNKKYGLKVWIPYAQTLIWTAR